MQQRPPVGHLLSPAGLTTASLWLGRNEIWCKPMAWKSGSVPLTNSVWRWVCRFWPTLISLEISSPQASLRLAESNCWFGTAWARMARGKVFMDAFWIVTRRPVMNFASTREPICGKSSLRSRAAGQMPWLFGPVTLSAVAMICSDRNYRRPEGNEYVFQITYNVRGFAGGLFLSGGGICFVGARRC